MPTSSQKFFLGVMGLLALSTTDLQAQSARPASSLTALSRAAHPATSPFTKALRGISTTVVRPGQSINYFWDSASSTWMLGRKEEYSYDAGARLTQIINRDSATSQLNERILLEYNAQGKSTSTTYQRWLNNAWENDSRYTLSYDAQGNETEYLSQNWNGSSWTTDFGNQNVYTYNAAGVITEWIRKEWDNGTFVNQEREVYTVTNGQWSSLVIQEWENGAWVDDQRILDVVWYDWSRVLPASFRRQEFNGTAFVDESRTTVAYSPNGDQVNTVQKYVGTAWVNDYRISELYDNYGNELANIEEQWINNAWSLEYGDRNLLFYNANNVVIRKVEQRFDNMLRQYVNNYRINYSNFQSITLASARNAALEARASLYPNPAAGLVTLEVADVRGTQAATGELRNALGQLVQQFTVQPQAGKLSTQLDLSGLKSGIYTVRLQTADGAIVKRVVRN
ncbi:T9SS type A sorting domain-containing protein [Hymenobacter lucidus]|uniref:T9SS type A sorting domain-containing protein n=1 Tax=Hymenobacter lucidus TaxID=2880930 RepID=A0ABS8ATL4_9BACT|nr:T9SS type A sorting domain-containing protein [Hymenobacter lucidus]MCB2409557.1 T9SS type A sorting domain-containing protein [Hymenobacter lucidus]